MRELTLGRVVHPEVVDGRALWVDPEVQDIVDRLQNGDPTLGWEGDPRMALYRSLDGRWELWRLEHDNEYRMVCRSRPGLALDARLIEHLVAHDTRRGFDAQMALEAHNGKVYADRQRVSQDRMNSAAERLRWALKKDLG